MKTTNENPLCPICFPPEELHVYNCLINTTKLFYNICREEFFSELTEEDLNWLTDADIVEAIYQKMDRWLSAEVELGEEDI